MTEVRSGNRAVSVVLMVFGTLAVLPALVYLLDCIHPRPDESLLFDLGASTGILVFLLAILVEFDTDGMWLWFSDVVARVKRWPLGIWFGVVLKVLGVLHGLTALVAGACLAMDQEGDPGGYRFWPREWNGMEMVLIVVWLWVAAVLAYLGGDCWMAGARKKAGTS